jgi:hypothetical protein
MRLSTRLYKAARTVNTLEAIESGNPQRVRRRMTNIVIGRALGRARVWRRLWR